MKQTGTVVTVPPSFNPFPYFCLALHILRSVVMVSINLFGAGLLLLLLHPATQARV